MSDHRPEVVDTDDAGTHDADWAWRRRVRANPHSYRIYRYVVALVGLLIVAGGLALVPLPGPGWLIVIFGIIVWASEFVWAERLRDWVRARLHDWNQWLKPKPWYVKSVVALLTALLVAAFFYLLFLVSGVPTFLPDILEQWVGSVPGL